MEIVGDYKRYFQFQLCFWWNFHLQLANYAHKGHTLRALNYAILLAGRSTFHNNHYNFNHHENH